MRHTRKGAETDSGAATAYCHVETIGGDAHRPMAMSIPPDVDVDNSRCGCQHWPMGMSQAALRHVETTAAGS
uniref:hypothetical protein n=1 Tax=Prevotella sp. TaxID=59823 RepID=UPI0040267382